MSTPKLEVAATFCALVGVPDLLAYLGAAEHDDATAVRARLKARRRFMQGMQNNPKYKEEAVFLIRHFQALDSVLGDLPTYLDDARGRAESDHIPAIELSIREALAGGPINDAAERSLRAAAAELGVRDATFERVFAKVCDEHAAGLEPPAPRLENSDPLPLDAVHSQPPRASDPPLVQATWEEGRHAQLEVVGDRARVLRPSRAAREPDAMVLDTIVVRNLGEEAMPGRIASSAPWLAVDPARLDPTAAQQRISVQVDPADIPRDARTATVRVATDDGQRQDIVYAIRRGPPVALVAGAAAVGLIGGLAVLAWWLG